MRTAYSSPPIHGAKLVAEVLGDPALSAQYYQECASMATRIKARRAASLTLTPIPHPLTLSLTLARAGDA